MKLQTIVITAAVFHIACSHIKPKALAPQALEKKVGRLFMEGWTDKNFLQVKNDASQGRIGGVLIYRAAYTDADDLKQKIEEIRRVAMLPLIMAIDGEGGKVLRLPSLQTPSAKEMGKRGQEFTKSESKKIASLLQTLRIDLNLAPVVDIESNLTNPISKADRMFSSDSSTVVDRATAFIEEHSKKGIVTTLKHFPGQGSTSGDTHDSEEDVTSTWRPEELFPYQKLFLTHFQIAVMMGHILNSKLDGDFPASLSKLTVGGLLRAQLGFQGVVITDDLQMAAISKRYSLRASLKLAIAAGNDFLLIGQRYRVDDLEVLEAFIVGELQASRLSLQNVEESNLRISKIKSLLPLK